jgi:hypothetical protein
MKWICVHKTGESTNGQSNAEIEEGTPALAKLSVVGAFKIRLGTGAQLTGDQKDLNSVTAVPVPVPLPLGIEVPVLTRAAACRNGRLGLPTRES